MGASAHEIVMESRQEIVDKLIATMEKGLCEYTGCLEQHEQRDVRIIRNQKLFINGINRFSSHVCIAGAWI